MVHAEDKQSEKISFEEFQKKFDSAIDDNLNTHLALSAFFGLVKEVNKLSAENKLNKEIASAAKIQFERMQDILGLKVQEISDAEKNKIDQMILSREELRRAKNFEEADKIRDTLNEMNVDLIDHKGKTIWMKKEKIKSEK